MPIIDSKILQLKTLTIAISTLAIVGCTKSPAEQCLESFRQNLISPNSAKVFHFEDGNLSYLAKNSNGVEIQGKAICKQFNKEWKRDPMEEKIKILNYAAEQIEANNACRKNGNPRSYCDTEHKVVTPDIARIVLGYN